MGTFRAKIEIMWTGRRSRFPLLSWTQGASHLDSCQDSRVPREEGPCLHHGEWTNHHAPLALPSWGRRFRLRGGVRRAWRDDVAKACLVVDARRKKLVGRAAASGFCCSTQFPTDLLILLTVIGVVTCALSFFGWLLATLNGLYGPDPTRPLQRRFHARGLRRAAALRERDRAEWPDGFPHLGDADLPDAASSRRRSRARAGTSSTNCARPEFARHAHRDPAGLGSAGRDAAPVVHPGGFRHLRSGRQTHAAAHRVARLPEPVRVPAVRDALPARGVPGDPGGLAAVFLRSGRGGLQRSAAPRDPRRPRAGKRRPAGDRPRTSRRPASTSHCTETAAGRAAGEHHGGRPARPRTYSTRANGREVPDPAHLQPA